MPTNYGVWLDEDQTVAPFGELTASQDPEATIYIPDPGSGLTSFQNNQLLPKAEVLGG